MIIFGTRHRHIATEEVSLRDEEGNTRKIFIHVQGTYAHIMWIPFIPFGKKVYAWLEDSQSYLALNDMPLDLKNKARAVRASTSYPKWFYSGLLLLIFFFAYLFVNDPLEKKKLPEYVNAPEVGDIYYVEENPDEFSSFKVNRIDDDSLYVHWNKLYVTKSYDISDIDKIKNYSDNVWGISRTFINFQYEEGKIIKIKR